MSTKTLALWVAYGTNGVVGSIRHDEEGDVATRAGAGGAAGTCPGLASAKGARRARMLPGSAWPRFQEH